MIKNRYGFCFIFNDEDKVLVLKRGMSAPNRPGEWDLAGGVISGGEVLEKGVRREVFEETGLALQKLEFVTSRAGEWHGEHHEFSYFRAKALSAAVTLSHEHDTYEWHEPLVASSMVGYKPHQIAYSYIVDSNTLTVQ